MNLKTKIRWGLAVAFLIGFLILCYQNAEVMSYVIATLTGNR